MLKGGGVKPSLKLARIEFQPGGAFILKPDRCQVIRIQPPIGMALTGNTGSRVVMVFAIRTPSGCTPGKGSTVRNGAYNICAA